MKPKKQQRKKLKKIDVHQKLVYFDYPFKVEAHVNTIISKFSTHTVGILESKYTNEAIKVNRASSSANIYHGMLSQLTNNLYFEKGIDFNCEDEMEYLYELETPKATWRSINQCPKGHFNQIVYEYQNEETIVPHTLLFSKKESKNMVNICNNEKELFQENSIAVELNKGNLVRIRDATELSVVKTEVMKINNLGTNTIISC